MRGESQPAIAVGALSDAAALLLLILIAFGSVGFFPREARG
jgi:hypothetical protein